MRATPVSTEDYLRKEMSKPADYKTDDKFNELIYHFAFLNKYEHLINMGMEGEDIS